MQCRHPAPAAGVAGLPRRAQQPPHRPCAPSAQYPDVLKQMSGDFYGTVFAPSNAVS